MLQIVLGIVREGEPRFLQCLWQIRQQNRWFFPRRIEDIKIMDEADGGDLTEHLIDECGEHPPCAILVFPQERKEFFAVECEGDPRSLLCEPDGDILHRYSAVAPAQGKTKRGCAPNVDVPVLPHGGRGEACEIDERKKLGAHALGREDQLIFRAALSKLE